MQARFDMEYAANAGIVNRPVIIGDNKRLSWLIIILNVWLIYSIHNRYGGVAKGNFR